MRLENKRILITGGGSGIGLELARQLADANDVVIAGRTTSKLHAARADDPRLRVAQLDVASENSASRVIEWLESDLGRLDVLVNNAGVLRGGPVAAADAATGAAEELGINLGGAIRMMRLALPLLHAAPESAIVFISSAVALTAMPGLSVYAATKAGLHSFARSLRAELAGTAVRVFEALPPVVDSEMTRGLDVAKLPASKVAAAIVAGIKRDREQIAIAQVRPLIMMARLSPRTADRIVQRALGPRRAANLQPS
jgi:uncharacterized oxidoreductase